MAGEGWEQAPVRGRRRWPLVLGVGAAVVVVGLLARTGLDGPTGDSLRVEPAGDANPAAGLPGSSTTPATEPDDPAPPVASGVWAELGDAPIDDQPAVHHGVWTGRELLVGFEPDVAALDPATRRWRELPPVPGPRRIAPEIVRGEMVGGGGQVFVYGGVRLHGAVTGGSSPTPDPVEELLQDGFLLDPGTGTWDAIPPAPAAPLWDPTAVWTGEELVVWGGARPGDAHELGEWPVRGSAWRPAERQWRTVPDTPVENVYFSDGLWTGREVVVWGTHHPAGETLTSEAGPAFAAAYDPATDTWRRLPAPPLDNPTEAAAVWTGSEVVLWGRPRAAPAEELPGVRGLPPRRSQLAGAALRPDRPEEGWRLLPAVPGLEGPASSVYGLVAAWTGQAAVFYGGYPQSVGLIYDPALDSWQGLPPHRARVSAATAWTGSELLLWGGYTVSGSDTDLWAFRATARSRSCPPPEVPTARESPPPGWSWSSPPIPGAVPDVDVWTGDTLLAWHAAGPPVDARLEPGVAVNADSGERRCLLAGPLAIGDRPGVAWTGQEVFVSGRDTAATYAPASDTWRVLPPAPLSPRPALVTVWTGTEVIVWGNETAPEPPLLDGAAYDPTTDTWRPVPAAPLVLNQVQAVWTGDEVLVHGSLLEAGNTPATPHAVGMAYSPASDAWRRLPDYPLSPQASSIAWTGSELVAWDYLLAAAAYDPASDTWRVLPRLPFDERECYPASALVEGQVFAWYCGQAALFDPATDTWEVVQAPSEVFSNDPIATGDAVLLVDHRGLWRYEPP